MKKIRKYWSLSLLINSLCCLIALFFKMVELEIPEVVKYILSISIILALSVLIYTSFILYKVNRKK